MVDTAIGVSVRLTPARFVALSAAAAVVASLAAYVSILAALPVWAMFMGWVTYHVRGHSARDGAVNFVCFAIGLLIGTEAAVVVEALAPTAGALTLPIVVLVVATLVISFRELPLINNIPAYFLGLITVFAAHLEPTFAETMRLGTAGLIGASAALAAGALQRAFSTSG